jgi:hypothetical protein
VKHEILAPLRVDFERRVTESFICTGARSDSVKSTRSEARISSVAAVEAAHVASTAIWIAG